MRRPSASGVSRALRCSWWLLPNVRWEHTSSAAASSGTRTHAVFAYRLDQDRAPMPPEDATEDEHQTAKHGVDAVFALAAEEGTAIRTEMAFSWQAATDTAWLLGCHIGRAYPDDDGWHGSADAMWIDGDVVHVADLKTGQDINVEPARENVQLATLALAAARVHGARRVMVHVVFASPTGARVDSHALDELDLDAHAEALRSLDARLAREAKALEAVAQAGDHCKWCPARPECPRVREAVSEALPELAQPAGMLEPIASPEDAASRVVRLRMVRDAWERAEAQVDAMLREWTQAHGPIPLGGGKVRRLVTSTRETIQWTADEKERAKAEGRVKVSTYETWRDTRA